MFYRKKRIAKRISTFDKQLECNGGDNNEAPIYHITYIISFITQSSLIYLRKLC